MDKLSHLIIDCETVPDSTLPEGLKPPAKYGNTKDPAKREKIDAEWVGSPAQIKSLSLSPATNKIVSLQMWSSKIGGFVDMPREDERAMLETMWNAIVDHSLTVGFNHISFDLPIFKMRSMLLNVPPTMPMELARYKSFPFYDVMQELAGWDNTKWKSQSWWVDRLGVAEEKTMDGSMVYKHYQHGMIDEIHDYCKSDVVELKSIFDKIVRHYPARN